MARRDIGPVDEDTVMHAREPARRRLFLMRHGEVRYFDEDGRPINPRDATLTPTGILHVQAAADALARVTVDRVISSDMQRARETAHIVAARLGRDVEIWRDFREIRAGRLNDLSAEQVETEIVHSYDSAAEPGARFGRGDSFQDFAQRVLSALDRLLSESEWSTVLIVAHDAVNRVILSWACRADLSGLGAFEQDPGCLDIVDVDVFGSEVVRRRIKASNITAYNLSKTDMMRTSLEEAIAPFLRGRVPSGHR